MQVKRNIGNVKVAKQLGSKRPLVMNTSTEDLNGQASRWRKSRVHREMRKTSEDVYFDLVETNCTRPIISSNAIDIMASILFPLSYVLFNVVYWSLLM